MSGDESGFSESGEEGVVLRSIFSVFTFATTGEMHLAGCPQTPLRAALYSVALIDQGDQRMKQSCSQGRCLHQVTLDKELEHLGLCHLHAKVRLGLIDSYYDLDGETVALQLP